MQGMKRLLISALAFLGLRSQRSQVSSVTAEKVGAVATLLAAEGSHYGASLRYVGQPDARSWGMSSACARMVRQHRLRRAGLGGAHI